MIDTSELKKELSTTYHAYCDDYKRALDNSFSKKIKELKPGEVAPKKSLFYQEDIDGFSDVVHKYRERGRELIEDALKRIREKKTDAPDSDAINFLTVFRTKKNVSEADIMDALERYGDNYSMFCALRDFAVEHNIYTITPHIYDEVETGLNYILDSINKMSVNDCNDGHAGDGFASVFDMMIDMNIPDCFI